MKCLFFTFVFVKIQTLLFHATFYLIHNNSSEATVANKVASHDTELSSIIYEKMILLIHVFCSMFHDVNRISNRSRPVRKPLKSSPSLCLCPRRETGGE